MELTHWGRDEMDNISPTTLQNVFSSMKMFEFRLKYRFSLFLSVQLTIFQHWFRLWLGAVQAPIMVCLSAYMRHSASMSIETTPSLTQCRYSPTCRFWVVCLNSYLAVQVQMYVLRKWRRNVCHKQSPICKHICTLYHWWWALVTYSTMAKRWYLWRCVQWMLSVILASMPYVSLVVMTTQTVQNALNKTDELLEIFVLLSSSMISCAYLIAQQERLLEQ